MDKDKTKYTVIRRELEPKNMTIELHCDQHPQPVDIALAGLHLAIESLEEELKQCPNKESRRHYVVNDFRNRVAQCKREVEEAFRRA